MSYLIKAFLINEGTLDCRFEMLVPSITEAIEFLERVDFLFEAYDYVKVYPFEKEV